MLSVSCIHVIDLPGIGSLKKGPMVIKPIHCKANEILVKHCDLQIDTFNILPRLLKQYDFGKLFTNFAVCHSNSSQLSLWS